MRIFSSVLMIICALLSHPVIAEETSELPANLSERMGIEPLPESNPQVSETDRAFGAFQRGMYLTAFELALPQAQKGDAAAQTLIGELYERGLGIGRDTKQAANWYKIASNSGNREAQFAYAVKLLKGEDVEKDVDRGLELMQVAAEAGHPVALFNYASHLVSQRPTSATYRKALPFFQKAAQYRLADAYYALAKIYADGLATGINDPERGKVWLVKAAKSGIDTAQVELGIKLLSDTPTDQQKESALSWFQIAANGGNVIAQNRLAHMYFDGTGTEVDWVEGAKWHILASRAGRKDFDLDRVMQEMPAEKRQKALEKANRWPSQE